MKNRAVRVCLLGVSYESGNLGVSALTASLVAIIKKTIPDSEITLLISHNEITEHLQKVEGTEVRIKSLPCRRSPLSDPGYNIYFVSFLSLLALIPFLRSWAVRRSPLLHLLDESDLIGDISGGDSFSDIYQYFRFRRGSLQRLWILRLGKPFYMLPQTYGPFLSPRAQRLAKKILSKASFIMARDDESADIATRISGNDGVLVVPDVAFCLEPTPHPDGYADLPIVDSPKPMLGLNVSGLLYNGGYTKDNMFGLKLDYAVFSHRLVDELLRKTDYNILLVPHTIPVMGGVEDDRAVCLKIRDQVTTDFTDRVFVSERNFDQGEIKALIGKCDFFIGARMHSCIAALSQGIPTVGVAYSRKFSGVFGLVGLPDWVLPAVDLTTDEALAFVLERIGKADTIRETLNAKVKMLQARVFDSFKEMIATRHVQQKGDSP